MAFIHVKKLLILDICIQFCRIAATDIASGVRQSILLVQTSNTLVWHTFKTQELQISYDSKKQPLHELNSML